MTKADDGSPYAFERFKGASTRIDAGGSTTGPIETHVEIGGFLVTASDLWGIDDLDANGKIYRIDVNSGRILVTMSTTLYDDENDPDHLLLQIRIGPQQLRYLVQRPSP
jgi:hypothetical protein